MKSITRPRWAALALLAALPLAACGGGNDGEPSTAEGQVETSTTFKAPSVKVAKSYEDLAKAGIVDPTKVVRMALQNAASIAGLLLVTEAAVAEVPEKEDEGHDH